MTKYQDIKGTHLFKIVDPFLYMYERSHNNVVKEMTSFRGVGHLMGVACIIIYA